MSDLDTNNRFKSFPLSEYEIINACKLSELQRQGIRNNIAGYAHDFMNVQYDDTQPHKGEYLRNYYRGAIEALEHLLFTDEEVRTAEKEIEVTTATNDFNNFPE